MSTWTSAEEGGRLLPIQKLKQKSSDVLPNLKKSLSKNSSIINSIIVNSNNNINGSSTSTNAISNNPSNNNARYNRGQLTVENALFPEHHYLFNSSESTPTSRKSCSGNSLGGGDSKSMASGSESITSKKKKLNRKSSTNYINPTDRFAQNLSDAVMDADDSEDVEESYVYRDKLNFNIPASWTYNDEHYNCSYYSSTGTESNTDDCYNNNNYHKEKHYYHNKRPVLRSSLTEIPTIARSLRLSASFTSTSKYYPSDDEYQPLVKSKPLRRRKPGSSSNNSYSRNKHNHHNRKRTAFFAFLWIVVGCTFSFCFIWIFLAVYSSPLTDVEVVGISNVLGTQKELMFNLQVRARNANWWTIRMSNAAFSVFASSHYVPTTITSNSIEYSRISNTTRFSIKGADPAEFLGTIYHLEDPLIYQPATLLDSVVSTATSQIQIKNPGSTHDDNSGNERWSLLIRYPYELTVRGVLKYQIFPYVSSQLRSVRVCKMSRIDPATGKISDNIPIPEKSICDDPSPVEGSNL